MSIKNQTKCMKCDGSGKINAFAHLDNGRCYQCQGAGTVELKTAAPMTAAKRRDIDAEIAGYIERPLDNGVAYEIAIRLLRLQDTGAAQSYLASMKPAMRAAVVAKGWQIKAEHDAA